MYYTCTICILYMYCPCTTHVLYLLLMYYLCTTHVLGLVLIYLSDLLP